MGIFGFFKKRRENKIKRLSLNEQIALLKLDFQEEIRSFEHFKELQVKKWHILKKIKKLWNKKWQEAEELVSEYMPVLIKKQLAFVDRDIRAVDDEDIILKYLIEVEERKNSILGHYINQNISQQYLSAIKTSINSKFIGELKETLIENSRNLKEKLIQLKGNIQKQSDFFNKSNPWSAINQDEEIVKLLNEEDTLTQRIERVINHLMTTLRDIVEYELRESVEHSGVSRREFLGLGKGFLGFLLAYKFSSERPLSPNKRNVYIDIFYGPHYSAEDVKGLAEKLKDADIYIPEMFGWTKAVSSGYQKVSEGRKTPQQLMGELNWNSRLDAAFLREQLNILYKSGKGIVFIDIPEGSPAQQRFLEKYKPLSDTRTSGGFEYIGLKPVLDSIRYNLKNNAEVQKEREEYMLNQMRRVIKELEMNQQQRIKKVKVLLSIGAGHTQIYHSFKKSGQEIYRSFSTKPFVYGLFEMEAIRRYAFGKEVDDELAAKILFELTFGVIIRYNLEKFSSDTQKVLTVQRKIISHFNYNEIEKMFMKITAIGYNMKLSDLLGENMDTFMQLFQYGLQEKRIKFPESKEQFTKMLPIYAR